MARRVELYVSSVCGLALLASIAVFLFAEPVSAEYARVALTFASVGILATVLAHKASIGHGSTSFVPFVAAVGLAPSVITVATVTVAVSVAEILGGRPRMKALFNIAQQTLAIAVAVLLFTATSNGPMRLSDGFWSLPLALASLSFLMINSVAVSGAVSASDGVPFLEVSKRIIAASIAYDFMSLPVVFMFVWAYQGWNATGVTVLAVPLFGLRQLYKTNWQLQKNNQDLLELMVAAIEARDPYTSGHSRRVARNAKIIARAVGLSSRQVERVATAALLHDVGKIYEIFAPILRKPDRLTPEEWAIMQTHPIKSAELVMKVSLLKDVVPSVRHHHENWDGTGYPDGIKGEAIPLGARIIMFADTIDAMLTDRPYRKALSESDVRAELVRCSGTQFDPKVCERLVASPQFRLLFSPVGNPTPVSTSVFSLSKVS